jgi:hypothetical protein
VSDSASASEIEQEKQGDDGLTSLLDGGETKKVQRKKKLHQMIAQLE